MTAADPRPDAELLSLLRSADSAAFETLYFRHRDWVYRLACRFARDQDAALDVLQETFAYLLRRPPGHLSGKLTTYLYPVVKNIALAGNRKTRRLWFVEVPDAQARPGDATGPATPLYDALADLPDTHREVLLMRVVDEMSVEEVAAALGIPEGTVKSRLHTALQRLRADPRTRAMVEGVEPRRSQDLGGGLAQP